MVLDWDGRKGAAMPRRRIHTLSVLQLAALLGSCSALPQFRQGRSELAPVVVWAQPQTPASDRSDTAGTPSSDFQSRFGLFAAQSETAEVGSEPVAVWPGPAWERSGSPAASDRSGEVSEGDDQVTSESGRAADLASYVTQLTQRGFSSGDELAFERPLTPRGQSGPQDVAEERSDSGWEDTTPQRGSADRRRSDASDDADGEQDAKLAVLRQRRKKLRLNRLNGASGPSRLAIIRRQRPSANSDATGKSEDPVSTTAVSERQDSDAEIATEAPRQRRPFGARRRQSSRRRSQQRRRRPVKKTTTTTTQRPVRRRRPTQPPASAAQTTEKQVVTQPTRASTAQAVYFQQKTEEYPQYPPFAPQEPTQAPQQPLQPPRLESPGHQETSQASQQPSQFANSLQQFSDGLRQFMNSQRGDNEQGLSAKVSKLKQKLNSEKEEADNAIPVPIVEKPAGPSFRAEKVTTRPLRELFDVLTRSELAKGSRRENYGPADRHKTQEPPRQSAAASLFRAEVQQFQTKHPQVQTDRPPLQLQRPESQTKRTVVRPAAPAQRPRSQPAPGPSPSERVVPSKIVYESGFEPITGLSHFQTPSASSAERPQASIPPPPSPQRPSHPSTFVSKERRPTTTQSRPKVTPQRPHRVQRPVQHTVQRPVPPPHPAPARERKPVTAGKVRFPGSVEPPKPSPSSDRPRPPPPGGRPHPGLTSGHPGPASFGAARPSVNEPPRDPVRRPGSLDGPRPSEGFPPKSRPGHEQAKFPLGAGVDGRPRPPIGQGSLGQRPFGGSHQSAAPPPPSGGDFRRPGPGQRPQGLRPFGVHQNVGDNAPSQSVRITGPTSLPPLRERPNEPPNGPPNGPPRQKQNRPPPFRTQQIQGSSPHSSRVQSQPPSGRPRPNLPSHLRPGPFSKGRPQGPPFNQLPSGLLSKERPRFPRPPPGQGADGQFPLKPRPDNRPPPRQIAEESIQHGRPLAPPRGQRPPGSFGQQRPPNDFRQRPHADVQRRPSETTGQPRPPVGQLRPSQGQRRPPLGFQQRPSGTDGPNRPTFGIQRRPSDSTNQNRPPFEFQQRPPESAGQQRPPTGLQQRPPNGLQQRPPNGLQQRPPTGPQSRPPTGFQQRPPSGLQQRPPSGLQQRPPTGLQQIPPTGFRQGASGPAGFGLRVPPRLRPGAGLPASAHPRNPANGPLADLTRRRDDQVSGQLLLQRG